MTLREQILEVSPHNKEKVKKFGEVFTPFELVEEMVDLIPELNKDQKILDPAAGNGQYHCVVLERLLALGIDEKHIIENQLYFCELQEVSCKNLIRLFGKGIYKINLYYGSFLEMPEDYFDLSYEERAVKYYKNSPQYLNEV